jgi:hypothetical protein
MVGLGKVIYEDMKGWFVESGSSRHMTRMRSIFWNFSESNTDCYVGSGTNTRKAIRRYGYVRYRLKSGGFLGMEHMLYVPDLKVNLLSVATFEDEGYAITFQNGRVVECSREDTPDTSMVLGIHKERLYRLLGRTLVWSNGYLDSTSDSMSYSTSTSEALSEVRSCETPPSTMGRMSP